MRYHHDHPETQVGLGDGRLMPGGHADPERPPRRRWTTRVLRAAPIIAAVAWLVYFLVKFGPDARGAPVGKALLITVGVSAAFAFASGTYERTRAFVWVRHRLLRRRIDWNAFDKARARWERHQD